MSTSYLRLIPVNPDYVPDMAAQATAREVFASCVPDAPEVTAVVTEHVEFINPMGNFERVLCPICEVEVDWEWWSDTMDILCLTDYTNLQVRVPCCGAELSLNDLRYEFPAGFARFVLEARDPNVLDIDDEAFNSLEQILGCPLRRVWTHI